MSEQQNFFSAPEPDQPEQPAQQPDGKPRLPAKWLMEGDMTILLYSLFAPIVTWPGYEDHWRGNKTILDQVTIQRFVHLWEVFREEQATELEAMLYLSTATLAGPPTNGWANIYFWLFRRWNPEAAKTIDIETSELDPMEREDLVRFRRWLFNAQVERLKERSKGHTDAKKEESPGRQQPAPRQQALFDFGATTH